MKNKIIFWGLFLIIVFGTAFMCTRMLNTATKELTPIDTITIDNIEKAIDLDYRFIKIKFADAKLHQVNLNFENSIKNSNKNTTINYSAYYSTDSIIICLKHLNNIMGNRQITYDTIPDIIMLPELNMENNEGLIKIIKKLNKNSEIPTEFINNILLDSSGYLMYNDGKSYLINPITLDITID